MLLSKTMIIGCLKSWYEIGKDIIIKKKKQVIFATPQHFNRAKNDKNPYIEKLISICKRNNISFVHLESPEYGASQPHDVDSVRLDILFWLMMLLYKITNKIYGQSGRKATKIVARIINVITFGRLKADTYITMAGLFIEIFQEMSPNATVYDLQHGIIYAGHPGYFDKDNHISESLSGCNCKILVWGDMFKDLFIKSSNYDKVSEKIKVIGYPIEQIRELKSEINRKTILISLEFTSDHSFEQLNNLKTMLTDALKELSSFDYRIKLKHHPRHNDSIDISDIFIKYPNVMLTQQSLEELATETLLHITWSSTTVFEYASYGVPSYILSNKQYLYATNIYYNQFKYPVFQNKSLKDTVKLIQDIKTYNAFSTELREWYEQIYSPFKTDVALSVLKKNEK